MEKEPTLKKIYGIEESKGFGSALFYAVSSLILLWYLYWQVFGFRVVPVSALEAVYDRMQNLEKKIVSPLSLPSSVNQKSNR